MKRRSSILAMLVKEYWFPWLHCHLCCFYPKETHF